MSAPDVAYAKSAGKYISFREDCTPTYTGSKIYLTGIGDSDITVKIGKTELTYGMDYEILEDSYVNNIRKGTASVKIRGINNYDGTKTVKFKIQPKRMESFGSIVRAVLFGTE